MTSLLIMATAMILKVNGKEFQVYCESSICKAHLYSY